jgi:non-homologous end joining protein Ku
MADGASEELRLAGLLIEAASGVVAWGSYRDQAAQELKALLEAKLADQPQAATEPARAILPLLEALQQSVAEQGGKGAPPRGKERASRKRAACFTGRRALPARSCYAGRRAGLHMQHSPRRRRRSIGA